MTKEPLLLFPNVHKVMTADRICKKNNITTRVIPVPEEISSECGMCLVVAPAEMERCVVVLEEQGLGFKIHKRGEDA